MNQHKYVIVEEKENPMQSTIEKSNVTVKFTLQELANNKHDYQKMLTQLKGQKQLEESKMKNIEAHHPYVLDFTEEQRFTINMYYEAFAIAKVCGPKIAELEEELAYIEAEEKEIAEQVGVAIPKAAVEPVPAK